MSARRKVAAAVGVAVVAGAAVALSQYVPPNERGRGAVAAGDLSGSLVGAGASSQQAAMQGWTAGYSAVQPSVTVDYDPVGSGGGREQFIAGGIDFAGSDAPLDEEELVAARGRCGGEVFELPNYISPIAVVHNLLGSRIWPSPPRSWRGSSPGRSPAGTTRRSPRTTPASRCPPCPSPR